MADVLGIAKAEPDAPALGILKAEPDGAATGGLQIATAEPDRPAPFQVGGVTDEASVRVNGQPTWNALRAAVKAQPGQLTTGDATLDDALHRQASDVELETIARNQQRLQPPTLAPLPPTQPAPTSAVEQFQALGSPEQAFGEITAPAATAVALSPVTGARQVGKGVTAAVRATKGVATAAGEAELGQPLSHPAPVDEPALKNAVSDIIEGVGTMATIPTLVAGGMAPAATARVLVSTYLAGKGGKTVAKLLGGDADTQRLAEDIAAAAAALGLTPYEIGKYTGEQLADLAARGRAVREAADAAAEAAHQGFANAKPTPGVRVDRALPPHPEALPPAPAPTGGVPGAPLPPTVSPPAPIDVDAALRDLATAAPNSDAAQTALAGLQRAGLDLPTIEARLTALRAQAPSQPGAPAILKAEPDHLEPAAPNLEPAATKEEATAAPKPRGRVTEIQRANRIPFSDAAKLAELEARITAARSAGQTDVAAQAALQDLQGQIEQRTGQALDMGPVLRPAPPTTTAAPASVAPVLPPAVPAENAGATAAAAPRPGEPERLTAVRKLWNELHRPPDGAAALEVAVPAGQSDWFYKALQSDYEVYAERAARMAKRGTADQQTRWAGIPEKWQAAAARAQQLQEPDSLTPEGPKPEEPPVTGAPAALGAVTPRDRFLSVYGETLAQAVAKTPEKYDYGPEGVGPVALKMAAAIEQGNANLNSPALKAAAKTLGISNTTAGWKAFFGDVMFTAPAGPQAAVKPVPLPPVPTGRPGSNPEAWNKAVGHFKRQLTAAQKAKNWPQVIAVADAFEQFFEAHPPAPDNWTLWQRAKDDAQLALQHAQPATIGRPLVRTPKQEPPAVPRSDLFTDRRTAGELQLALEGTSGVEAERALAELRRRGYTDAEIFGDVPLPEHRAPINVTPPKPGAIAAPEQSRSGLSTQVDEATKNPDVLGRTLSGKTWYHGAAAPVEGAWTMPTFLTTSAAGADWFAVNRGPEVSGAVYPVKVHVQRPFQVANVEDAKALAELLTEAGVQARVEDSPHGWLFYADVEDPNRPPDFELNPIDVVYSPKAVAALVAAGFDAFYEPHDVLENGDIPALVPFDPTTQITGQFEGPQIVHAEPAAPEAPQAASEGGPWPYPTMATTDIFPAPVEPVRAKDLTAGGTITEAEAAAKLAEWKAEAERIGREEDHSNEIVISLFDHSGKWSEPYEKAGYQVARYDIKNGDDLLAFFPVHDLHEMKRAGFTIVGVLAAPPCTSFAVSGARWWKDQHDKKDEQLVEKKYGYFASRYFDTPLEYANTLVAATQEIVALAAPTQFHVLENPIGRIATQNDLPAPTLTFDPANFGDPYTKRTQLWGAFNPDLPTANVAPRLGSFIATLRGDNPADKEERSLTPEGFAYAFFMANHQAPEPVTAAQEAAGEAFHTEQQAKAAAEVPTPQEAQTIVRAWEKLSDRHAQAARMRDRSAAETPARAKWSHIWMETQAELIEGRDEYDRAKAVLAAGATMEGEHGEQGPVAGGGPAGAGAPGEPARGAGTAGPEGLAPEQPAPPGGVADQPAQSARARKRGTAGRRKPAAGGAPAPGAGVPVRAGAGVDDASHVDTADVAETQDAADAAARGEAPRWFRITTAAELTEGGWTRKLDDNLAALTLLKLLTREGRPASDAEQAVLARYVGWGHTELAAVVDPRGGGAYERDPRKKEAREKLEQLLTADELKALGLSAPNAHYSFQELPAAMWRLAQHLGFKGGAVLEPAVGTGHFLGTMPGAILGQRRTRVHAVDMEPIAAGIAQQLYQGAYVQASPLEEAVLPDSYFDLTISNVPFGKIEVFDPAFVSAEKTPLTRSIHNYYFAKALDLTRPGGLLILVTSRYTLDSRSDVHRRYLEKYAIFRGAFRLPDTAFRKTAGTDVVTDVIVLQKRGPGVKGTSLPWVESVKREDLGGEYDPEVGGTVSIFTNEYFKAHPDRILGTEDRSGKMARTAQPQYNVTGPAPTTAQFDAIIDTFPTGIYKASTAPPRKVALNVAVDTKQGAFVLEGGRVYVYDKGTLTPSTLTGKALARAKSFIPLRDAYLAVLDATITQADDQQLKGRQALLTTEYHTYVRQHGHLNTRENRRVISADPNASRILALENIDVIKGEKGKPSTIVVTGLADIFSKRLMRPPVEPTTAGNAHDALLQSVAWKGGVDLAYMTALTGQAADALTTALAGEVFEDVATRAWVTADAYLSGDVVTKLAQAEAAAKADARFAGNVIALTKVQPRTLTVDDFTGDPTQARSAPFGATWVPVATIQRFLQANGGREARVRLLNTASKVQWYVEGSGTHEFMPPGADYAEWVQQALMGELPTIRKRYSDGTTEVDLAATERYRQSLAQLREAWATWWKGDAEAADQLVGLYNALFNRTVERAFSGDSVVVPNSNPEIQLREGQKVSVAGALHRGNTLLAKAVGWGKTFELIAIAGEWKRLGFARKPVIVVPNHIVEQWRRAFLAFYPAAKVLLPEKSDFEQANRKRLIGRIANNDWDAVVLGASQFLKVGVKLATLKAFIEEQTGQLLAEGASLTGRTVEQFSALVDDYGSEEPNKFTKAAIGGRGVHKSVKDIARAILNLRKRLKKRTDQQKKDPINFEELGIDGLLVDEAHMFKNLYFYTSKSDIVGLKGSDADQALDMFLKVQHINEASNYRNTIFATATPISNTMSELYTVFRYLAPQVLARLGMAGFDAWANAYATAVGSMEPRPEGGYKERTRLAEWTNLRELSAAFRQFADVITTEDILKENARLEAAGQPPLLKLPKEKPVVVQLEPHPEAEAFMQQLRDRIEAIRKGDVPPNEDNHLKITSEASAASIDLRLVMPQALDFPGGRLRVAAKKIHERYVASTATKGTQLVFLDLGTPKGKDIPPLPSFLQGPPVDEVSGDAPDEDSDDLVDEEIEAEIEEELRRGGLDANLYGALKDLLVEKGIKPDEVAYIHQATNPSEQHRLFEAVRTGAIRVLLTSRAKGGTGMNVQNKVVAIHHVDVPWRPDQLEQANGRGVRQGNENAEVEILRYVTKKSFDEYRWYLLSKKQGFIANFYRGESSSLEDVDTTQLDMQVASALASGDPRTLQLISAERALTGLRARHENFSRRQSTAQREADAARRTVDEYTKEIAALGPVDAALKAWAPERPVVITRRPGRFGYEAAPAQTFSLEEKDDRKKLKETLIPLIEQEYANDEEAGRAGPFRILRYTVEREKVVRVEDGRVVTEGGDTTGVFSIKIDVGGGNLQGVSTLKEWDPAHPPDLVRGLDHALDPAWAIDRIRNREYTIRRASEQLADARKILDKRFEQQDELDAKEQEVRDLRIALGIEKRTAEEEAKAKADGAPTAAALADRLQANAGAYRRGDVEDADFRAENRAIWAEAYRHKLTEAVKEEMRRREKPPGEGGPTLQATVVPGGAEFVEQDVLPALVDAAEAFRKAAAQLRRSYAPATVGAGVHAAGALRAKMSIEQQGNERVEQTARVFQEQFDRLLREKDGKAIATEFIDAIEHGAIDRLAGALQPAARFMRDALDELRQAIQQHGKLEEFNEYYFPHIWKFPRDEAKWIRRIIAGLQGNRPFEGSKAFLKQRTYPTFREGLEALQPHGVEPISWNPVDLFLIKMREMRRYLVARDAIADFTAMGIWKPFTGKHPEGWTRIDGPLGTIYGPPVVAFKEAFDPDLFEGLEKLARDLGVTLDRKARIGGKRLGYAVADQFIMTKAAGPEGVLMHEIGHILDERYGLRPMVKEKKLKKELRALADLRFEGTPADRVRPSFKRYVRKGEEKIANLVHAFLYAPERAKKIAPNSYWALHRLVKANKELTPLLKLQKTRSLKFKTRTHEINIGGFPEIGHYAMPDDAARIFNNHLSRGLAGQSAIYDAYRWLNNSMVTGQLAFSGVRHLTFTGLNALFSEGALALQEFSRAVQTGNGQLLTQAAARGMKTAALGTLGAAAGFAIGGPLGVLWATGYPIAAAKFIKGWRGKRRWQTEDPAGRLFTDHVRQMVEGGFRPQWDQVYRTNAFHSAIRAFRQGNYPGALLRTIPAAIDAAMLPIMSWVVPSMKTAAYLDLAAFELDRLQAEVGAVERAEAHLVTLPKGKARKLLPPEEQAIIRALESQRADNLAVIRQALNKAQTVVDNRFGEVLYDTWFWKRWQKDLLFILFRAPGWNAGTWKEFGGAAADLATAPRRVPAPLAGGGGGKGPGGGPPRSGAAGPEGEPGPDFGQRPSPTQEDVVSSRMAYVFAMIATTMLMNGLVHYLSTGQKPEGRDWLYPRGPDGKRMTPVTYLATILSAFRDPGAAVAGITAPLNSALYRLFVSNSTWNNEIIREPGDPFLKQAWDALRLTVGEAYGPFVQQNIERARGARLRDKLNIGMGVSQAPSRVQRSAAENYLHDANPSFLRSHEEQAHVEQRRQLREDLKAKNYPAAAKDIVTGGFSRTGVRAAAKGNLSDTWQKAFTAATLTQALHAYELATPAERREVRGLLYQKYSRLIRAERVADRPALIQQFNAARQLPVAAAPPGGPTP